MRIRAKPVWLLATVLLHGAILGLLQRALFAPPPPVLDQRPLRLVWIKSVPEHVPQASRPAERRSPALPARDAPQTITPPLDTTPSATAAPSAETDASASPAPVATDIFGLDPQATRRAVRQAARTSSIAERAALASSEPARSTAQQRMSADMAKSAHGDCLKGEYAGGGMGVLSLPFWLLAEARSKCSR